MIRRFYITDADGHVRLPRSWAECRFVVRFVLTTWLIRLIGYTAPEYHPDIPLRPRGGQLLAFNPRGTNLGRPVLDVISRRGRFHMGTIEFSNQWGRARFVAAPDTVFDKQCIAEIYAAMREFDTGEA